ncbi:uncharacterized protein J3R85_011545 [Psidium guajava]|nr:uncharacterized protein J3R85_011545 [Psidium guajava]
MVLRFCQRRKFHGREREFIDSRSYGPVDANDDAADECGPPQCCHVDAAGAAQVPFSRVTRRASTRGLLVLSDFSSRGSQRENQFGGVGWLHPDVAARYRSVGIRAVIPEFLIESGPEKVTEDLALFAWVSFLFPDSWGHFSAFFPEF